MMMIYNVYRCHFVFAVIFIFVGQKKIVPIKKKLFQKMKRVVYRLSCYFIINIVNSLFILLTRFHTSMDHPNKLYTIKWMKLRIIYWFCLFFFWEKIYVFFTSLLNWYDMMMTSECIIQFRFFFECLFEI